MSDEDLRTVPLKHESPPAPTEPVSAIAALRTIRVARGISLEDAAARLKFAPRLIDAFESERWDELPNGIGLKTLAKNYTRFLGVDYEAIEPILRDHLKVPAVGISNHTSTRSIGAEMGEVRSGSWAWIILILVVIAVVLGIAVWQGILPESLLPSWLQGLGVGGQNVG
jgi:cytoskeleton protein RodZ